MAKFIRHASGHIASFGSSDRELALVVQSEFEILLEQILLIEPSPLFSFELWDLGGLFLSGLNGLTD